MTTQPSKPDTTPYVDISAKGAINKRSIFLRRVLIDNTLFSTFCALLLTVDTGAVAASSAGCGNGRYG